MKYFLIAVLAIGLGFGAAKLAVPKTNFQKQATESEANLPMPTPEEPFEATAVAPPPVEKEILPPAPVGSQIDNAAVLVIFSGTNGKDTYAGSFEKVNSNLKLLGTAVVGSISIDVNSLATPVPAATANWKSKTYFMAETYPTATFTFSTWKKITDSEYVATGKLAVKGLTKAVTVPITFKDNQYIADITLQSKDVGFPTKMITSFNINVKIPLK